MHCSSKWVLTAAVLMMFMRSGLAAMAPLPDRVMTCISEASIYHSVNISILEAIVRHESRGRADTVTQNTNGSIDVGLTGINSVHFQELARKGVYPQQLKDGCVAVYVGAWKLSQSMAKYNNSWWAVGSYHSKTPFYNTRYQVLIFNELVDMGVMAGPKMSVPALPR